MDIKDDDKSLLICPKRDSNFDSRLEVKVAESIFELSKLIEDGAYIVSIPDTKIVRCLTEYSDLFDVTPVVFTGVPGCDYDVAFESVTWNLDRLGYDALVLEAETVDRMSQLKMDEQPLSKRAAPKDRPLPTEEEVAEMRVPEAIDFKGPELDG